MHNRLLLYNTAAHEGFAAAPMQHMQKTTAGTAGMQHSGCTDHTVCANRKQWKLPSAPPMLSPYINGQKSAANTPAAWQLAQHKSNPVYV